MLKPHEAPRRRDTVTLEFLKDTQQIKPFLWVWLEKHIKEKTREIHMPSLEVYCFSLPAFNSPKDHAPCTQASLASLASFATSFSSSQTLSQLGRAATQRPLSTHFQRSSAHPFFDTRTRPFYDHLSFPLPWTTHNDLTFLRLRTKKPVPLRKLRRGKSQDWCQKHQVDLHPDQWWEEKWRAATVDLLEKKL